jgi:hypothetical protein
VAEPDTCLVHLVWAPLGPQMLEDFVNAYREQDAGFEHRLVAVFNGFDQRSELLARFQRLLDGVDHEALVLPRATRDLTAYHTAAAQLEGHLLCFLNSYSRPVVGGWLRALAQPHTRPDVGLTGIGGSFESAYSSAPFWLRRRRAGDFLPFPNPHLRSNGFMIGRELLLDLDWPHPSSKVAAWGIESGARSMSRQVWERDLDVLVVGRDGIAYAPERWRESATFRSGEQRNLLIADNRTRQYEQAKPTLRRRLEQMAWGAPGAPAPTLSVPRPSRA